MVRRIAMLLVVLLVVGVGLVGAQDAPTLESSGLLIYDVWVRPTAGFPAEGATPEPPPPGTVSGAFMTIENTGEADYQLVGIHSNAAEMTHIHETTTSGEMSGMRMISAIDIPAGETVSFESGGYHAMMMDVIRDITPGEAVALTLTFADADGATFDVPVAGIATDLPPEAGTLIAANVVGTASDDGSVDIALVLNNRADQADALVTVSSTPAATISLRHPSRADTTFFTRVEVPAGAQTVFGTESVMIRLSEFAIDPNESLPPAVTLLLSFDSGSELTVAVPIVEAVP